MKGQFKIEKRIDNKDVHWFKQLILQRLMR